jgi:hypothetical protein
VFYIILPKTVIIELAPNALLFGQIFEAEPELVLVLGRRLLAVEKIAEEDVGNLDGALGSI